MCQAKESPSTRKRTVRPHSPSSTATTVSSSSSSSAGSSSSGGVSPVASSPRGNIIHFQHHQQQQRDAVNVGRGGNNGRRSPSQGGGGGYNYSSPPRQHQQRSRNNKNRHYKGNKSPTTPQGQNLIHDTHPATGVLRNKYTGSVHDAPMSKRDIYFALDCEMVGVGPEGLDSAVARVTIVNWDEEIVLDTFVKVPVPVTDYRTFVSGITAEDIDENSSAVSLQECREAVKTLLRGKILIGHALTNDLQAIGMTHPWTDTRDTATYPPYMREHVDAKTKDRVLVPRKLRDLTWETLGKQIQYGGKSHCPVEDALAALGLYKAARAEWEVAMVQRAKIAREEEDSRRMMRDQVVLESMARHNVAMEMTQRERAGNAAKARAQAQAQAQAQTAVRAQQQQHQMPPPPGFYNPKSQQPQPQQQCRSHAQQRSPKPTYSPNQSPPRAGQPQPQPPQIPNVNRYYTRLPPQITPVSSPSSSSSSNQRYDRYDYGSAHMMHQQQQYQQYSRRHYTNGPPPRRSGGNHAPIVTPPALQV